MGRARKLYLKLIARHPEYSDAYNFMGILEFQDGRVDKAEQLIRHAIGLRPDEPGPYNNLGNIFRTTGNLEGSIEVYQEAAELAPDDPEIANNLQMAIRALERTDAAMEIFRQAAALNPKSTELYERTVRAMFTEGRTENAAEVLRCWLQNDPENPTAQHLLAAMLGEAVPERATEAYVEKTFDQFANTFDKVLERLDYKVPNVAVAAMEKHWSKRGRIDSVLDAGCGTGLCGPLLRPNSEQLIGVDLSSGMLAKASERNVYDELIKADLTDYLQQQPEGAFEVILAADTLVYFGDLSPLLAAGFSALNAGGLMIFSLESMAKTDSGEFSLTPSGRYAHADAYVRSLSSQAGFSIEAADHLVGRTERGVPVKGQLWVLRKPGN